MHLLIVFEVLALSVLRISSCCGLVFFLVLESILFVFTCLCSFFLLVGVYIYSISQTDIYLKLHS